MKMTKEQKRYCKIGQAVENILLFTGFCGIWIIWIVKAFIGQEGEKIMKEELEKIGLELREWCEKYEQDYVTMAVVDKNIMANNKPDTKDFFRIYIRGDK